MYSWETIERHMSTFRATDGGFTSAQRGIVHLPGNERIFVKIGTQENTKKWAKKEIAVYRILHKVGFSHSPKLVAVNHDETAFALESYTADLGWNWQDNWDERRLEATLGAMEDLTAILLSEDDRRFLAEPTITQSANGWRPLLESKEHQEILLGKMRELKVHNLIDALNFKLNAERSLAYKFGDFTLVHYDIRADNCAWNDKLGQVRMVDWNWTQLGDGHIELAATLTQVKRSGYELPEKILQKLNADPLHWMAGFWLNSAVRPIWPRGPENLRGFQLQSGLVALDLRNKVAEL
jgi:hypothetical protein